MIFEDFMWVIPVDQWGKKEHETMIIKEFSVNFMRL